MLNRTLAYWPGNIQFLIIVLWKKCLNFWTTSLKRHGEPIRSTEPILVACAPSVWSTKVPDSGWHWVSNFAEDVKISSEFSGALFPNHSNCPKAQRWEASTREERRAGLKRWGWEACLIIPKGACSVLCLAWWCLKEDSVSSFSETFGQVPPGDKRTFSSDGYVLYPWSNMVATTRCGCWAFEVWLVQLRNRLLNCN